MKRPARSCLLLVSLIVVFWTYSYSSGSAQSLYLIDINTSGLLGTSGGLAFDLVAGDAHTPNNTAVISLFTTDGTLLGAQDTNTGDASGDLPGTVSLQDSGLSESFREITLGTDISYTLSLTTNQAPPGVDEFAFFITDPSNTGSIIPTSDPTGSDALFLVDIDGSPNGQLTVYTPSTPGVSYTVTPAFSPTVPEPSSACMAASGLAFTGLFVGGRGRRRRVKSTAR